MQSLGCGGVPHRDRLRRPGGEHVDFGSPIACAEVLVGPWRDAHGDGRCGRGFGRGRRLGRWRRRSHAPKHPRCDRCESGSDRRADQGAKHQRLPEAFDEPLPCLAVEGNRSGVRELVFDQALEFLLRQLHQLGQRSIVPRVGATEHHLELVTLEQRHRSKPAGELRKLNPHSRRVATRGRDQVFQRGSGSNPEAPREQLDARSRSQPDHAAHAAASERSARRIESEWRVRGVAVDGDRKRRVGVVSSVQVAAALPNRIVDAMQQSAVAAAPNHRDLGAGVGEGSNPGCVLE